nr:TATA element modulatory factor [Hymenolepis microstoma]
MAWWSSVSNVSKLAHTALKEAQRKLDKVLDIEEDASQISSNSHIYFDFDGNAFHPIESAKIVPNLTTSLDTTTSRRDRPASSSLSSGPMSESEGPEMLPEGGVYDQEKSQSALSLSSTADQGNVCSSMKLSTSETLTTEISPQPKSHSSEEDGATSKEIEKHVGESIKGEVECSLENLPKEVASNLFKSRVDDESGGTTTSSEIEVISTCTSLYDDSFSHQNTMSPRGYLDANASVDVLYQKLSGMAKLLEAREAKLVEICRANLSLQEVNEFLHTKLEEAGLPHDFNTADLQSLTDEFTERLSKVEKRLQAATRERDELKSQLASATKSTESNLKRVYCEQENVLKSRCALLENTLAEKETQLADLLSEGNRMAQEQLKTNNLVKSLRSKTKSLESEKEKIGNNLTKAQVEIDSLKSDLSTLRENESKLQESFNQLTRKNFKLEKEVSGVKVELDASREKAEALNRVKLTLESKLLECEEGLASAQAALNESQTRRDAIRDVEEEQQSLRDEVSTLRAQLEEARVATSRQKVEADQRLRLVRQEVDHYREQLAESESRLQSLGETATSVAKPLLQQIQSLQSKLNDQSKEFEKTEHSLLSQITDLKKRLEVVEHIDRQSMDRLKEAEAAADALRLELALERENSTRLRDQISHYNLQASADKSELENWGYLRIITPKSRQLISMEGKRLLNITFKAVRVYSLRLIPPKLITSAASVSFEATVSTFCKT